jgi:addiction module HigA family antidote
MIPKHRLPTHPGEILTEEFLRPMGITQSRLAGHLGIPIQRVNEIANGKRGVTPDTAWLFAEAFGTSPEFWVNLQTQHDLAANRPSRRVRRLRRTGGA